MEKLQHLDYVVLFFYVLMMVVLGTFLGWFIKDIKGYFKGGNTIPWLIGGVSNYMGLFSSFVFVAYAGIAYTHGLIAVVVLWSAVVPCLIAAIFLGPRWRRTGIITPVEYLETRFDNKVRQTVSWGGLAMRFLDNMVRLYAIGVFIVAATDLDFIQAVLWLGLAISLFTIMGGIWAVVVLDTIQFVILVFITLLLVPLSLDAVGGLQNLIESKPLHFNWFEGPKGQPLWLLVYYLLVTLKYNANWVFIQRLYSVKDEASARKLGFFSAFLFLIFPVFFLVPAIAANSILPNLPDPEMAYVAVAVKLLPAGFMGLMLAAMFSTTSSTLNSEFNVMSGVITNDIYARLFRPLASEKHLIGVARLSMIFVGTVTTVGALFIGQLGGAFEANKLLTGLFAIPLAIPLIGGVALSKPTPIGAILTIVLGMASGLILNFFTSMVWEVATLIEIMVCVIVFVSSAWWESRGYDDRLKVEKFFRRLKTPLSKEEIPSISRKLRQVMLLSLIVAFVVSWLLILFLSIISPISQGSQIAMISSWLYLIGAAVVYFIMRRP